MALFQLLVAVLLFLNALAILNEERFLAKRAQRRSTSARTALILRSPAVGWHNGNEFSSSSHSKSLKSQALGVINAVSYMRSACRGLWGGSQLTNYASPCASLSAAYRLEQCRRRREAGFRLSINGVWRKELVSLGALAVLIRACMHRGCWRRRRARYPAPALAKSALKVRPSNEASNRRGAACSVDVWFRPRKRWTLLAPSHAPHVERLWLYS